MLMLTTPLLNLPSGQRHPVGLLRDLDRVGVFAHHDRDASPSVIPALLDRLAQKGVVERRKRGRAWVYTANVSEEESRSRAIAQLVEGFFGGSAEALSAHLATRGASISRDEAARPAVPAGRPILVHKVRREKRAEPAAEAEPGARREKMSPELDTTLL